VKGAPFARSRAVFLCITSLATGASLIHEHVLALPHRTQRSGRSFTINVLYEADEKCA
jgi:hypothetical protein